MTAKTPPLCSKVGCVLMTGYAASATAPGGTFTNEDAAAFKLFLNVGMAMIVNNAELGCHR